MWYIWRLQLRKAKSLQHESASVPQKKPVHLATLVKLGPSAPALWFTEVALDSLLQSSGYAQGFGVRRGFLSPGSTSHQLYEPGQVI